MFRTERWTIPIIEVSQLLLRQISTITNITTNIINTISMARQQRRGLDMLWRIRTMRHMLHSGSSSRRTFLRDRVWIAMGMVVVVVVVVVRIWRIRLLRMERGMILPVWMDRLIGSMDSCSRWVFELVVPSSSNLRLFFSSALILFCCHFYFHIPHSCAFTLFFVTTVSVYFSFICSCLRPLFFYPLVHFFCTISNLCAGLYLFGRCRGGGKGGGFLSLNEVSSQFLFFFPVSLSFLSFYLFFLSACDSFAICLFLSFNTSNCALTMSSVFPFFFFHNPFHLHFHIVL